MARAANLKVLMFHGLCRELPAHAVYPGTRTCIIRQRDFESCIRWCTRTHRILTLADLPAFVASGSSEPGILITFDDGLASVIDLAVPVLEKYGVTAVLFVTTGWIDAGVSPAIMRLERRLWEAPPGMLTVKTPLHDFSTPVGTRSAVPGAMAQLWAFCFSRKVAPLALATDWVRLDDRRWEPDATADDPHGWHPASWDGLATAARSGVLELGGHGVSHTPWSWLDTRQRRREIGEPAERLQGLRLGTPAGCAYPHGMYDDAARVEVREHYKWAFTTEGRAVRGDPGDLMPRFHVPSERPVRMDLIVRWPFAGRVVRKAASLTFP